MSSVTWIQYKHTQHRQCNGTDQIRRQSREIRSSCLLASCNDKVADFGKKAIDVVDKVVQVGNQIVQLLPPVHPYIISLQKGLAVAAGITSAINSIANKKQELQAVADEYEADVYEYQSAAKQPGLTDKQREKLVDKSKKAKERLAAAKQKIRETESEEKKLLKEKKQADATVVKKEQKVKEEANKLKKQRH